MANGFRSLLPALLLCASCRTQDAGIPDRDGALVLQVRHPTDSTPVPAGRSTAIWGTVGTGQASLRANGQAIPVAANGTFASFLAVPDDGTLRLVARDGDDSVVRTITLQPDLPSAAATPEGEVRPWRRWVMLRRAPSDTADSATQWRPIYARWRPGGEIAVPLPQGVRLLADARTDASIRLLLTDDQRIWVPIADADTTAAPRPAPVTAGPPRMTISDDSSETLIAIALPERLPSTVEMQADRLYWTVYGASWRTRPPAQFGTRTPVRRLVPRDSAPGRLVVDLGLSAMPLGWRVEWTNRELRLRIRRAPSPGTSLHGLIVTLDAGHPPDGTAGPSGLTEDSVTLAVATSAAAMLRAEGATVLLTRSDGRALSLEAGAAQAGWSPAHLFVSLHVDAPGPGRPPESAKRTRVYFTNPNALHLARHMSNTVASALHQRSAGTQMQDFAVLRPAWATAVLVEGSVIVLPEIEALFRTRAGIDAYASGVVEGIQRWHADSAARRFPDRNGH